MRKEVEISLMELLFTEVGGKDGAIFIKEKKVPVTGIILLILMGINMLTPIMGLQATLLNTYSVYSMRKAVFVGPLITLW